MRSATTSHHPVRCFCFVLSFLFFLLTFANPPHQIIVATDVAARGLDIPGVDIVFHYRLPNEQEAFVHRTGRTGRAGKEGINIVLLSEMEEAQARNKYFRFFSWHC